MKKNKKKALKAQIQKLREQVRVLALYPDSPYANEIKLKYQMLQALMPDEIGIGILNSISKTKTDGLYHAYKNEPLFPQNQNQ